MVRTKMQKAADKADLSVLILPVHNAYIEQLDSSVYNIELYTILSYLL